jgi:hypothetical protein
MKRILFHLPAWVSAALCAASIFMCLRSILPNRPGYLSVVRTYDVPGVTNEWSLEIDGSIPFYFGSVRYPGFLGFSKADYSYDYTFAFIGAGVKNPPSPATVMSYATVFMVPYWFFALVSGIPSFVYLRRQIAVRRRRGEGLCRRCGYDLRASPDRCPECGTTVPTKEIISN